MNGIIFSRLILILGFILSVFILFYYRNLDHSAMIESLSEILRKFNPESLYYSGDNFSEMSFTYSQYFTFSKFFSYNFGIHYKLQISNNDL